MRISKHKILNKLKERDGLTCGICGKSLEKEWRLYEKWREEPRLFKRTKINIDIDHIIPKSFDKNKHWWEDLSNLQLTHISCNKEKGNLYQL